MGTLLEVMMVYSIIHLDIKKHDNFARALDRVNQSSFILSIKDYARVEQVKRYRLVRKR